MPPYGNNLFSALRHHTELRELLGNLLADYNSELNIDINNNNKPLIQLRIHKRIVFTLSWNSLADTLKRYMFYLAATSYNNATVVTLQEPEAHSFPPYVSSIADRIIENSNCQFFIATHSPYLLNNLIENTPSEDLAIFICGFDQKLPSTTARKLSSEDLSERLDYGVDIFFNLNRFLDQNAEEPHS